MMSAGLLGSVWHWVQLVVSLALLALFAYMRLSERRRFPGVVRAVAGALDGKVLPLGFFSSARGVQGTYEGHGVRLEFLRCAAGVANTMRITVGVPAGLRCRVRRKHARDDLLALGIQAGRIDDAGMKVHIAMVFPDTSYASDLRIKNGRARITIPWAQTVTCSDGELEKASILLALSHAVVIVDEITAALQSEKPNSPPGS